MKHEPMNPSREEALKYIDDFTAWAKDLVDPKNFNQRVELKRKERDDAQAAFNDRFKDLP